MIFSQTLCKCTKRCEAERQRANMADRRRALPPWMAKKEEKTKEKAPLKSRGKRKTTRAAFYCMNERELVEAAVACLTSAACEDVVLPTHRKVEDAAIDTTAKMKDNAVSSKTKAKPKVAEVIDEESSDCTDAQDTTYVSETDLDLTEVETVPYTTGPEGQRSGPVQDGGDLMKVGLKPEKDEVLLKRPADAAEEEEEDDAFRLVREIFFT